MATFSTEVEQQTSKVINNLVKNRTCEIYIAKRLNRCKAKWSKTIHKSVPVDLSSHSTDRILNDNDDKYGRAISSLTTSRQHSVINKRTEPINNLQQYKQSQMYFNDIIKRHTCVDNVPTPPPCSNSEFMESLSALVTAGIMECNMLQRIDNFSSKKENFLQESVSVISCQCSGFKITE